MPQQRPSITLRWTPLVLVPVLATAAAAQRFVWPPAAGDRMAPPEATAAEAPGQVGFDAEPPLTLAARPEGLGGQPMAAAPAIQPASAGPGRLDWQILENPNGPHTALIFDPVRQVFAVYHVDAASGQIMLKSVRNLSADLRLEQFNSGAPAPKDIQAMIDEAR